MTELRTALDQFSRAVASDDPKKRAEAADDLGDVIEEADFGRNEAESAAAMLLEIAYHDGDDVAREALLNTLCMLVARYPALSLRWELLTELLDTIDATLVPYVLEALSWAKDRRLRPVFERYIDHPDLQARDAAVQGLQFIDS